MFRASFSHVSAKHLTGKEQAEEHIFMQPYNKTAYENHKEAMTIKFRKTKRLIFWATIFVAALIIPLHFAGEAQAAIVFDAASSGTNSGNTITVPHTTGSGANRLMIVGISVSDYTGSGISVTSVKWNTNESLDYYNSYVESKEGIYIYYLRSGCLSVNHAVGTVTTLPAP